MSDTGRFSVEAVRERMLALETEHGDDHAPVGVVIARLLDLEHDESFDEVLGAELKRAAALAHNWYEQMGLEMTPANLLAVGMLQGVTLAAAVLGDDDAPPS